MPDQLPETDPNKHVFDYLNYYCSEDRKFEYAVMLKGPWGSGKTFIIDRFIRSRESDTELKTLYVSLYGLNSTSQIDDQFFRQLHPILSHKGMKIAASIAKSFVKTAIKIDLNADAKDDLTVSSQMPDIEFKDYFSNPNRCLLIFDDLERCEIKIEIVLGYINSLVEHEGLKAILVANEDEILKKFKDEEHNSYKDIKEKLVGQTLEIRSSADDAFVKFVDDIKDDKTRSFISINRDIALETHLQSKRDNLRVLKQALWDFERLSKNFEEHHWNKPDPIRKILKTILILSIEYRNGSFQKQDFNLLEVNPVVRRMRANKSSEKTKIDNLEEKYDCFEIVQDVIFPETIKDLLDRGWVNREVVISQMNQSSYYADPKAVPDWKLAWNGFLSTDADFEAAVTKVEDSFARRCYKNNDEILHVFGLRLMFSEIGAITTPQADIVKECKLYIDDLLTKKEIGNKVENRVGFDITRAFDGLSVYNSSTSEYNEIFRHYIEATEKSLLYAIPRFTSEILKLMGEDTNKLFRELCVNNVGQSRFYNIPLLSHINPDEFADRILSVDPNLQQGIFTMLDGRYRYGQLDGPLSPEKQWLIDLEASLKKKIVSLPVMSKYRINTLIGQIINPINTRSSS